METGREKVVYRGHKIPNRLPKEELKRRVEEVMKEKGADNHHQAEVMCDAIPEVRDDPNPAFFSMRASPEEHEDIS